MVIEFLDKFDSNSILFKKYDYSSPGIYFVTICTGDRICYFGNIVDGIMISFPICEVVRNIWLELPERFAYVNLDAFIIMPNHFHGIFVLSKEYGDLIHQRIIRYFKAKSTKTIQDSCFSRFEWQCSYYEYVVHSAKELSAIRHYIVNNPMRWALDRENRLSRNYNVDLDRYLRDILKK